jgi:hypothetical protein
MKSSQHEYLTEVSLGQFLRERVDATFVSNQPVRGLERRFRPDYHSEALRHAVTVGITLSNLIDERGPPTPERIKPNGQSMLG